MTLTMAMTYDPLAAAVAAAAELAKTGAFLYNCKAVQRAESGSTAFPLNTAAATGQEYPSLDSSPSKSPETIPYDESEDEPQDDETEEEAERRIARSRERNREHARRTRLRKKAQLEALQSKVKGLQAEGQVLKQSLEECSIASILVGLSHKNDKNEDAVTESLLQVAESGTCTKDAAEIVQLVGGKRKRFVSPDSIDKAASNQPLKLKVNGRITYIGGGRTHINWKTGVYSDEHGVQKQLTQNQLENLRRERNRMHAKMTRDRKKNFIATIEKTIDELESNNGRMKAVLAQVVQTHFKTKSMLMQACPVTPETSSVAPPSDDIPPLHIENDENVHPAKKVRHGFSLS